MMQKENRKTIEIWGTGKLLEWLYVEDGANALIKCLSLDSGITFNVGVNKGYSVTEIVQAIANEIKWDGEFI